MDVRALTSKSRKPPNLETVEPGTFDLVRVGYTGTVPLADQRDADAVLAALRQRRDHVATWLDGPAKKATLTAIDRMIAEREREAGAA